MESRHGVLKAVVAVSLVSIGTAANAIQVERSRTYSLPMAVFASVENNNPGATQKWLTEVETRIHGKVQAITHDEADLVDLTCFDCDAHQFDASVKQAMSANDFRPGP